MQGKRIKAGGRKKGTPNKVTATIRETLKAFLQNQQPEVEKAFKKLSPKAKVMAYARLLPYVTPAYQSISMDLSSMSEEDLEAFEQRLRQKYSKDGEAENF